MKFNIRLLYLYLFSFVGLLIVTIGSIQLVDLGLKTYVFRINDRVYIQAPMPEGKDATNPEQQRILQAQQEEELANQRKRTLSNSIAMIAVGLPLYFYHWATIKREHKG